MRICLPSQLKLVPVGAVDGLGSAKTTSRADTAKFCRKTWSPQAWPHARTPGVFSLLLGQGLLWHLPPKFSFGLPRNSVPAKAQVGQPRACRSAEIMAGWRKARKKLRRRQVNRQSRAVCTMPCMCLAAKEGTPLHTVGTRPRCIVVRGNHAPQIPSHREHGHHAACACAQKRVPTPQYTLPSAAHATRGHGTRAHTHGHTWHEW